jgi:hypothetical protein
MQRNLPDALLDLTLWDQLSPQECERLAQYIEGYLPPSFRFAGSGQNGNDVIQYENDSVQRGLYGHDYAPVPALSK